MKKNFLYSVAALFMCLFASCSQEEIIPESGQGGKVVRMTVGVPGGAATRALPTVEGSKLRCIMQVVDAGNNALTGEGMRQVQEVAADKITFVFTAPEGDYKCLFWADFVTEVNTDNIYNTADLTNITYHKTDNAVFSPAADAFCGYVAHGTTTIQLKRPFAKVSITPNNATDFQDYTALTVTYDAPSGFNMVTQTTSGRGQAVTFTNDSFDASAGAWFSSFLFAPANADKLQSAITMKLADASGNNKTLTIAADKVPLTGNFEINGKFDAAEGSNSTSVEVSFDDSFAKPELPALAIGQYVYADGTWGTTATDLNGGKAVGIVFHVGKYDGDNGAYPMTTVHGYAVALKDATEAGVKWAEEKLADPTTIDDMVQKGESYDAYTYSKLTTAVNGTPYNQLPPVKAALEYNVQVDTEKTSGWYLPTSYQLKDIYDNLNTLDPQFEALGEDAATFQKTIYWGCVIATSGKPFRLQFDPSKGETEAGVPAKASDSNTAQRVRSILTF